MLEGHFHSVCCLRIILIKMLYILVWTLTVLCSFWLVDGNVGHHQVFPSSPVIERGSTLRLFCSLGKGIYPHKNASHIIWTLNEDRIAKENYKIVNDSLSEVVIYNFTYGEAHAKCFADFPHEKQYLASTEIKSGFPPQIPENISCIDYMGENITCSWTSEQETYIETDYRIIGKSKDGNSTFLNETWTSKNVSRSFNFQTRVYYPEFYIQLMLENPLGKAKSQYILQKSEEILKLEPTPVKVENIPGKKKMLNVSWEGDMNRATCRIRYRNMKQTDSKEAYNFREISRQNYFELTTLQSFTEYAVAIQCIFNGSRFWSEWGREQIGTTEEEVPSKEVDLWRVLEKCQPAGSRQVHLLWKQLKENESLGIIKGYRIKCYTKSNHSVACAKNTTDESVTVLLMGQAYVISVIAHNAAGDSPEAVLRIPSCAEESMDHPRVVILNTSVSNEQMIVEWKTSDSDIHSYVIEWYDVLEIDVYKRSWQYIGNNTTWTFQKGAFEQYKCYNISVYPVYKDEIKAPSSITAYFKQGRPLDGPAAKVENINKNEAIIKWKEIEKGKANGAITNYTIFYRPEGGNEIGKTVNASLLQYQLKSLQSNVKYTAHVMASTIAGGTNGSAITFYTKRLSLVEIVLIYLFAGLLFLGLLTFTLLWGLKRRKLKKIFWPKIPYPKLPEMSQDNLEKPLKEPQSEENTVIPEVISVLKVDDHDEYQLLKLEDCLGQTKVTTEDALCQHEASGSREAPSLGQHFRSQLLPAPVIQQPPLPKPEESSSEDYQNSSCKDEEKQDQDQTNMKEKPEFNPYLKNSVRTREFLVCETFSVLKKKEKKKQPVLPPACVSGGNGQQYVALDAIVLTEH